MTSISEIQAEYVSATDAAKILKVSRQYFYLLLKNDNAPASVKVAGARLFRRDDIATLRASRGV